MTNRNHQQLRKKPNCLTCAALLLSTLLVHVAGQGQVSLRRLLQQRSPAPAPDGGLIPDIIDPLLPSTSPEAPAVPTSPDVVDPVASPDLPVDPPFPSPAPPSPVLSPDPPVLPPVIPSPDLPVAEPSPLPEPPSPEPPSPVPDSPVIPSPDIPVDVTPSPEPSPEAPTPVIPSPDVLPSPDVPVAEPSPDLPISDPPSPVRSPPVGRSPVIPPGTPSPPPAKPSPPSPRNNVVAPSPTPSPAGAAVASTSSGSKNNVPVIAGAAAGGAVLFIVIVALFVYLSRRNKAPKTPERNPINHLAGSDKYAISPPGAGGGIGGGRASGQGNAPMPPPGKNNMHPGGAMVASKVAMPMAAPGSAFAGHAPGDNKMMAAGAGSASSRVYIPPGGYEAAVAPGVAGNKATATANSIGAASTRIPVAPAMSFASTAAFNPRNDSQALSVDHDNTRTMASSYAADETTTLTAQTAAVMSTITSTSASNTQVYAHTAASQQDRRTPSGNPFAAGAAINNTQGTAVSTTRGYDTVQTTGGQSSAATTAASAAMAALGIGAGGRKYATDQALLAGNAASNDNTASTTGSGVPPGLRNMSAPPNSFMGQARQLESLRISMTDISLGNKLGQGGFGAVFRGTWQGNRVAVKMLSLEKTNTAILHNLYQEALIMSELRHPCIARVFGLVDEVPNHAIVMQYYKRGTVARFMNTSEYLEMDDSGKLRMALQVATGMRFMHEKKPTPILHGDLKISNLLLEDDGRVVIADFGLASNMWQNQEGEAMPTGALTLSISPPEVLNNPTAPRTAAADVYAFGIVLLEIMTGTPAYKGMRAADVKRVVCEGKRPTIPDNLPPSITSVIEDCWNHDAKQRPTFPQIADRLSAALQDIAPMNQDMTLTSTLTTTYY